MQDASKSAFAIARLNTFGLPVRTRWTRLKFSYYYGTGYCGEMRNLSMPPQVLMAPVMELLANPPPPQTKKKQRGNEEKAVVLGPVIGHVGTPYPAVSATAGAVQAVQHVQLCGALSDQAQRLVACPLRGSPAWCPVRTTCPVRAPADQPKYGLGGSRGP